MCRELETITDLKELPWTFAGVLTKKYRQRAVLNSATTSYISMLRLEHVLFDKNCFASNMFK